MRIHVTGAGGFVGRWLCRELSGAGHEVTAAPAADILDIADRDALVAWLGAGTDAVIHLAGMAYGPDASVDPHEALRVNVGGTIALFEALRRLPARPAVLVAGSSEVYGLPADSGLPLHEGSPLNPVTAYGISKCAQESVAVEMSVRYGFPVVVTRSFNHSGPGQRPVFALPALARRVDRARRAGAATIAAGNVDVRRDIGDVRDVVRAYRLLAEMVAGAPVAAPIIANVATGRARTIRWHIECLCRLAGIAVEITPDQALIRREDPPEIVGDNSLVRELTGWQPMIPIEQTLADLLAEARAEDAPGFAS